MRQRSGEYFAPNPILSLFCMGFALKFGGEDQKNKKKGLHRKILGYLITFTWSVLLFHRKNLLWWPVLGQKFASCTTAKVYSRLGSTSSDLGHGSKCYPPCKGVARIFNWGGAKPKITCNDVIRNFQKRNFLWDKDIEEWKIRSCGLVWHLTESFLKGEGLKQNLQMKISKLGDLCK